MLAAEIELLDQLVKTHRQVHRRADYFQRIDSVRRAVHTAFDALHGRWQPAVVKRCASGWLMTMAGDSLVLAAVDRALGRIPPAWRLLHHLLAQSYFMPYALVHLAILARLSTLLMSERTRLAQTGARAAGDPPLLCALTGGAVGVAPDAAGGQVGATRAVSGCASSTGSLARPVGALSASPAAAAAGVESDDDLGEAVADERSQEQLQEVAGDVGETAPEVWAPGVFASAAVPAPAAADEDHKRVMEETGDSAPIGWAVDTAATPAQLVVSQTAAPPAAALIGNQPPLAGESPPVPDESRRCASLAGDHPPASAAPILPAQASLFREAEQAVAPAGGGGMAAPSHLEAPGQQGGKRRREEGNAGEAMEASMPHASRQGVVAMPEGLMGEAALEFQQHIHKHNFVLCLQFFYL